MDVGGDEIWVVVVGSVGGKVLSPRGDFTLRGEGGGGQNSPIHRNLLTAGTISLYTIVLSLRSPLFWTLFL